MCPSNRLQSRSLVISKNVDDMCVTFANKTWFIGEEKQLGNARVHVCRMNELIGPAKEAGKPICPGVRKFPGVENNLREMEQCEPVSDPVYR